jgi:hypothetical protein
MAWEPNFFRLPQILARSCPDPASKRSLGVWDRYGRSQRRYQLLALCCCDRLGGNVNDDAPLDPPVVVLRTDDRDGDGVRPAVVGSVVDCPALPIKESAAHLPRADPCRVFGFGGHGRFLPSMKADHTLPLIARQDERCCSTVLIRYRYVCRIGPRLHPTPSWFSFSRKGPEFLERLGGLAPVLSVKNQQMLPTGMGHIEAASVEIKLANLRVTQVDDAGAVPDIRARPQLAEALTGS